MSEDTHPDWKVFNDLGNYVNKWDDNKKEPNVLINRYSEYLWTVVVNCKKCVIKWLCVMYLVLLHKDWRYRKRIDTNSKVFQM